MEEKKYLQRVSDKRLRLLLEAIGAVLIEGPKWCGKTSSARQQAKSVLYMQDPDKRTAYMQIAETKPSLLLQGDTPRLLDEWQDAPVLWDAVRFQVNSFLQALLSRPTMRFTTVAQGVSPRCVCEP